MPELMVRQRLRAAVVHAQALAQAEAHTPAFVLLPRLPVQEVVMATAELEEHQLNSTKYFDARPHTAVVLPTSPASPCGVCVMRRKLNRGLVLTAQI